MSIDLFIRYLTYDAHRCTKYGIVKVPIEWFPSTFLDEEYCDLCESLTSCILIYKVPHDALHWQYKVFANTELPEFPTIYYCDDCYNIQIEPQKSKIVQFWHYLGARLNRDVANYIISFIITM